MVLDTSRDLRTLVASRHQLLVAAGRDERRVLEAAREVATPLGLPIWTWTVARGLAKESGTARELPAQQAVRPMAQEGQTGTADPAQAVAFIAQAQRPGVFLLLDASPMLDDPVAVRRLKELANAPIAGRATILTGVGDAVPEALRPEAVLFRPRPPDVDELAELLDRTAAGLAASGMAIRLSPAARAQLLDSLRGITAIEAERIITEHTVADGLLGDSDLPAIRAAKAQLLSADSPLDLILADVPLSRVGGLPQLKSWMAERGRALEPAARQFGVPYPRGVLLTGVPGTGKSLIAKAIASSWGMALVALDTGRLHGSLVGESEQRLTAALDAVEAMAPVVLWIDEIEKAVGGSGDNDGGVAARVLGVLLRWLQERPDGVFVVATCNDVSALPPELTRRGRFDEVFFVDLPTADERAGVLQAQLAARGWDPRAFDLDALARVTEGFSGAELESVVVSGLYAAYAANRALTTQLLIDEAAATVPLSVLRAEDIAALREWSRGRAIRA